MNRFESEEEQTSLFELMECTEVRGLVGEFYYPGLSEMTGISRKLLEIGVKVAEGNAERAMFAYSQLQELAQNETRGSNKRLIDRLLARFDERRKKISL